MELRITHKTAVTYYPYRTAMVDVILTEDRDENQELEAQLDKLAGQRTSDNHCVYEVKNEGQPSLYLWMEDTHIYVGTSIRKGSW